ncbi:MAG: putative two-component sensor histidine kinase, partial [Chloroflexi bacterium]|nr:putative two-component sensor histidine kinase [Chloroflexota bacterium]
MNFNFTFPTFDASIISPKSVIGWVIWTLLLLAIGLLLFIWRRYNKAWGRNHLVLFIVLLIFTPLTSLFFIVSFPSQIIPPPGSTVDLASLSAILFSALPWVLAGGLLGPLPAAILGLLSGLLESIWSTHSPYSALIVGLLAVTFSAAMSQRYRTVIFRWLRQPLLAAFILSLIYPFIYLLTTPYLVAGSFIVRLDFALTNLGIAWLVTAIELLIAAFFAQLVKIFLPTLWGGQPPFEPSPSERSLQARFTYLMTPLAIMLVLVMIVGSWSIAGSMARGMLKNQMHTATRLVADQVPYYFDNAQHLIQQIASDPRLYTTEPSQLNNLLGDMIKTTPFFRQLVLLDETGQVIGYYPNDDFTGDQVPIDEQVGIQMALNGLPIQDFSTPPLKDSPTAQTSFIAPVKDANQGIHRVLLGRVDLATNPLTEPIVTGLKSMDDFNAQGILLDKNNQILIHPDQSMIMKPYQGKTDSSQTFYTEISPDGTSKLVYYQPITGSRWAALISLPSEAAQLQALQIAVPMLGLIILISLLTSLLLNFGVMTVTKSIESLATEADSISKGNLNQSILMEGEDEVGRLRQSIERMRLSLKSRLDELNQLLKVSRSVAANLEMGEAVQPVLDAVLSVGASLARVVISPPLAPDLDGSLPEPNRYSAGP